jgi:hypothetical protein
MMEKLEKETPMLICKLERYSLQDDLIQYNIYLYIFHMKAKLGDPQQYSWMYHIKRALKNLRAMTHNKTRVEDCIVE